MADANTNTEKQCTKCGEVKSAASFYKHKASRSGLRSRCKQCESAYHKAKWEEKADKALLAEKKERRELLSQGKCRCVDCKQVLSLSEFPSANQKRWKCRPCMSAQRLEWSRKNRDKERENWRRKSKKNPEKKRAYNARYRAIHRERLCVANRKWYQENKDYFNAWNYEYQKKRLANDPVYAMRRRVSRLIGLKIQNNGYTKRSKTTVILGCDWEFFKRHIERQFLRGMTWENRDRWHLDHIIPMATAETEEDVIRLNHYTNLRPMWAKANLSKGAQLQTLL